MYCDATVSDFKMTNTDTTSDNTAYVDNKENAVQEPLNDDIFEDYNNDNLSSENQNSSSSQPSSKPIDSSKLCILVGCEKEVVDFSSYCSDHKCTKSGCRFERFSVEGSSLYCSVHMCNKDGCDNLSKTGQLGGFCKDHTCSDPSCEYMKNDNGNLNYCSMHGCAVVGCGNAKSEYLSYCTEHACIESNCPHQKELGSNYCISHGRN